MPRNEKTDSDAIDWSLTTWEGAEREQLRRWAALSLEQIVRAQEEMLELAERLSETGPRTTHEPRAPGRKE